MTQATFRNPRGAAAALIVGAAMWVCLCLIAALVLSACVPVNESARVECRDAQGVYFDHVFVRAEIESDGRVRVWVDGQSVVIDADCVIAPAAQ